MLESFNFKLTLPWLVTSNGNTTFTGNLIAADFVGSGSASGHLLGNKIFYWLIDIDPQDGINALSIPINFDYDRYSGSGLGGGLY